MRRFNLSIIKAILITLFLASPLFAEVVEPINRINISPISGVTGSGLIRGVATFEKYEYKPDQSLDTRVNTFQGEFSIKLIEQVGVGIVIPYHIIENENIYSGISTGKNDETGIGNVIFGGHVQLPNPSQDMDLIIGANVKFPTANEDVSRKVSTFLPYTVLMTRDGDLSFTLSAGYEIYMDEQRRSGETKDVFDNTLHLQGSAMFSASEVLAVGAQFVITTADDSLVEFVPQIRVSSESFEWGVAATMPIGDDHPHISTLEKSFGIIIDAGLKF